MITVNPNIRFGSKDKSRKYTPNKILQRIIQNIGFKLIVSFIYRGLDKHWKAELTAVVADQLDYREH